MLSEEYQELMELNKDYVNITDALYKLKTFDEAEIERIYQDIKTKLIESKKVSPSYIIDMISVAMSYNLRYTKSYMAIFEKLYEDYQPKQAKITYPIFAYLIFKEYDIVLDKRHEPLFDSYLSKNISIEIHEKNSIYRAIMDDDLMSFITFTEQEGFDKNAQLNSPLYPYTIYQGYYYLDLCCYYGAVNCFKLLRSKFGSPITTSCLEFSFLGRNAEILSECMKESEEFDRCKKYAIISHNIDFVSFLMNEHNINIYLGYCDCHNLHAFLVYLDQTKDFNTCFVHSPNFCNLNLCEYLISHGADVNAIDDLDKSALHTAAESNCKEIVEFLLSHGANVDAIEKTNGETPLHKVAEINNPEIAELLISHGANVNATNYGDETPLHLASNWNCEDTAKVLIDHGADVNAKAELGRTPLHCAAKYNSYETAELLISHGADINAKDLYGITVLQYASRKDSEDVEELLYSLGADEGE
ncbi:ankyrin repeat protein, putative [Trichomonas vaginalis G3]|uniref:Ankyrin repeat protein, putative n=1 Tax=Trichomonas vaginalis (strain ATCC PRA-98 / G3) TaxID=412133 RepID=A2E0J6_TRIV3|nr:spectrin binding [Trichomonas vaginalis G3]EAY13876.1 ankyrin repeat protein, putative [Trichomonas vaginalis G3]KAI5520422.1 spectrin binding [Trichomonas vaginalis G3]|eukprot:XP_001326099.1 ankyrin repeat protein [Trichomonas vaginalis G3]